MLTIKKPNVSYSYLVCLLVTLFMSVACMPPGPKAALEGETLIQKGRYQAAIRKLEAASKILNANAKVWNLLGLAYHKAGKVTQAEQAYQQALRLDHNLSVANYNLGCLLLSNGRFDDAIERLTTYRILKPDDHAGYLRLGIAQAKKGQHEDAEKSFREALAIKPGLKEAINNLGYTSYKLGSSPYRSKSYRIQKLNEAYRQFTGCASQDKSYHPAYFNILALRLLTERNPERALDACYVYTKLQPPPPKHIEVQDIISKLESSIKSSSTSSNALLAAKSQSAKNPITQTTNKPAANSKHQIDPDINTNISTNAHSQPPTIVTQTNKLEIQNSNEVTIDVNDNAPGHSVTNDVKLVSSENKGATEEKVNGNVKINPELNSLNESENKNGPRGTPLIEITKVQVDDLPSETQANGSTNDSDIQNIINKTIQPGLGNYQANPSSREHSAANNNTSDQDAPNLAAMIKPGPRANWSRLRYQYYSQSKRNELTKGDNPRARILCNQGTRYYAARYWSDAIRAYNEAVKADPSFFEAYFFKGLTAEKQGVYGVAQRAFETALLLRPDSLKARAHFAMSLEEKYPLDAAIEYEKLLAKDSLNSTAHFQVAKIYHERLDIPELAKRHYQIFLNLEPRDAQATNIRRWINNH
jgi:Flp pilus assembly protein TadD